MVPEYPIIYWFRRDLRLLNNPALSRAASRGVVIPVFILDEESVLNFFPGTASRWWLHHSLKSLSKDLEGKLFCFRGSRFDILSTLCKEYGVREIYCNRYYESWSLERDSYLKKAFNEAGIQFQSFHDSLLYEPETLWKGKINDPDQFEDFYGKFIGMIPDLVEPLPKPENLCLIGDKVNSLRIEDLHLISQSNQDLSLYSSWNIGETGVWKTWKDFLAEVLVSPKIRAQDSIDYASSRLSAHLHRGEISISNIVHDVRSDLSQARVLRFLRWLCHREFAAHMMLHLFEPTKESIQDQGNDLNHDFRLKAWQEGKTGYPCVDAAMRELYQTGFIPYALRQLVSSFLVHNLAVDWRKGRAYFADRLVDADLASNGYNWIKIATSPKPESSPRFFHPVEEQGRMNSSGSYILRFLPELKNLPLKYLFQPWLAPEQVLLKAGIRLGNDYPQPIVPLPSS